MSHFQEIYEERQVTSSLEGKSKIPCIHAATITTYLASYSPADRRQLRFLSGETSHRIISGAFNLLIISSSEMI